MNISKKSMLNPKMLLPLIAVLIGVLLTYDTWSFPQSFIAEKNSQPLAAPNPVSLPTNQFIHSCQQLECLSFAEKSEYSLAEVYRSTTDTLFAYYKSNSTPQEIRLEVMSTTNKEESIELLQKRIARIEGIFQKDISPYPGEISDSVVCGNEFQPEIILTTSDTNLYATVSTYLNERKVLGACVEAQKAFSTTIYLLTCPNKAIIIETLQSTQHQGLPKLTNLSCN